MANTMIDTYHPSDYQALPRLIKAFHAFAERPPQRVNEEKMMEIFHTKMIPYEFGFNEWGKPAVYKDLPDKPVFYAEFNTLLEEEGLTGLLGLTLLTELKKEGVVKLEKTFGRSNVVFNVPESSGFEDNKETVPAQ
ncbi:hypothetical protein OQA88_11872 [Cercophora sp. LCS_1]